MNDKEVGFPWLLVVQIVLAIISFLLQKTSNPAERRQLVSMRDTLQAGIPGVDEGDE